MRTDAHNAYRHEFKYIISNEMMTVLQNRINNIIPIDPHVNEGKKYLVRSVYFDDYADTCYYENENGVDPREKYRIRIYNCSDNKITLECKRKERDKTHKTSCPLSRYETMQLIHRQMPSLTEPRPPVLRKFLLAMTQRLLRPVTIVEYQRTPYTYPLGNVRVTFDTHIVSSTDFEHFFDKQIVRRPVMPTGFHLMEVKYDEYLPDFIYNCLQLDGLERTAFSKYYLSRKYNFLSNIH